MDAYPVLVENPILTVLVRYEFLTIHLNFKKSKKLEHSVWGGTVVLSVALATYVHCPKFYLRAYSTTTESFLQVLSLQSCVLGIVGVSKVDIKPETYLLGEHGTESVEQDLLRSCRDIITESQNAQPYTSFKCNVLGVGYSQSKFLYRWIWLHLKGCFLLYQPRSRDAEFNSNKNKQCQLPGERTREHFPGLEDNSIPRLND